MLNKVHGRFSSAHVIAALALFVALGGTAIAVKKGSIGTKQLKKEAVTTKKLADNAATGAKVDESTLGTVPSATKADSADAATKAGSADTATLATKATTADAASTADALQTRTIAQVRSRADGAQKSAPIVLPQFGDVNVLSETIAIPPGGASLIATGTTQMASDAASNQLASCELQLAGGPAITQLYSTELSADEDDTLSLTGFADVPNGNPSAQVATVLLACATTSAGNDVSSINADLVLQAIPTQ